MKTNEYEPSIDQVRSLWQQGAAEQRKATSLLEADIGTSNLKECMDFDDALSFEDMIYYLKREMLHPTGYWEHDHDYQEALQDKINEIEDSDDIFWWNTLFLNDIEPLSYRDMNGIVQHVRDKWLP